jgi:hypothetical protein
LLGVLNILSATVFSSIIAMFSAMFVVNGLLLATLLFEPSLRKQKEMLIIAGMAGTDTIYALGTITIAVYRLFVISQGVQNELMTAWECMILSPFALLQIGSQLSSVMNVVLSSDRLIAVAWPTKYRVLDARYSRSVMVCFVLINYQGFP